MANQIHTAPPGSSDPVLGKTLPELMYEACARFDNAAALNQPVNGDWTPLSLDDFRRAAEETALGLLDLGLARKNHVAFYMESDVHFCIADMGCLIAGIINVPIYLSHASDVIQFVMEHAEAKALFVTDLTHLEDIADLLDETPKIQYVIAADAVSPDVPEQVAGKPVYTLEQVRQRGRAHLAEEPEAIAALLEQIDPHDLATIIYTSGTTGQPKGVMLSHENISFNAYTSFNEMGDFRPGPDGEVNISFLPLTHIFARSLHYGMLAYAVRIYFTSPDQLSAALPKVRPTTFATVPRVLEKVYARIQERITHMTGVKKKLANWALDLAGQYELGKEPTGWYKVQLMFADLLVFKKWRAALGGRVRFIISGGAALNADLTNLFAAAGVQVLQGYGLTETSPVIAFNRPGRNRAGTVGEPIPGVEVRIAEDGEILTRGPHVMQGYYKDEERTRDVIDEDGWFHTGDVGEFTDGGYLCITDRKKDLFKLSTGKYVMPQPLENRLGSQGLVEQAVVVGEGYKFCTALIFPDEGMLRSFARSRGLDPDQPLDQLVEHPLIVQRYQELVDEANEGMDHWSTIKRFTLVPGHLTVEDDLLTPTMKVKRTNVGEAFAGDIKAMYAAAEPEHEHDDSEGVVMT